MKKIDLWVHSRPSLNKLIMELKIVFLFILVSISNIYASPTYSQVTRVSLNKDKATLEQVMDEIEKQSEFYFIFNQKQIDVSRVVNIHAQKKVISDILSELFDGTDVSYAVFDKKILLTTDPGDNSFLATKSGVDPKKIMIKGTITDFTTNESIPGVNVVVKGTTSGTTSDDRGNFSIEVSGTSGVLLFSFIGYISQEIALNGQTVLKVALKSNDAQLSEVVVVGYGIQTKREVSGSIASISGAQMKELAATSFENAIQGKVAGVEISVPSGEPGAAPTIRIRGTSSISAGNDPLYVIDGLPISSNNGLQQNIGQRTDAYAVPKMNPFSTINPNDIQSIEVLKDASAAGIYGSRGSNGVIMVTTKKGNKDGTRISFNAYSGIQEATHLPKLMNSAELIQYTKDSRNNNYLQTNDPTNTASKTYNPLYNPNTNAGRPNPDPLYFLIPEKYVNWDGTDTKWLDLTLRSAMISNYNVSISGGKDNVTYYTSGGYYSENGTIKGSKYDRYTFRTTVIDDISKKLQVGSSINISFTNNDRLPANGPYAANPPGIIYAALVHSPIIKPYNADGTINQLDNQSFLGGATTTADNPLAIIEAVKENIKNYRLFGNAYAKYSILNNLSFKTYLGIDLDNYQQSYYKGVTLLYRGATKPDPFAQTSSSQGINWLWENTLDYNKKFGKDHALAVLVGYTAQKQSNELKVIQANSFPDDKVQTIGGGIVIGGTNIQEQWSLVSSLARVNYTYKEKYLFTGTLRSDRSSRFGAGHQTGSFPSASFGWRIDDEPFMKKLTFVNEFKLRASYGLTGNFEIPNYGSIGLLSGTNYVMSNTIVNGVGRSTLSNDMLSWESKKQLDIGLDFGFYRDRIYGTFDYYRSVTSDLLLNVTIPSSSGFSTALTNIGEVENKGFEFTISSKNIVGKDFQWSTDFNISSNRNKVLKLGATGDPILSVGSAGDIRHITRIGDPVGSYYGYQVVGVYQTMAQIAAAPVDKLVGTGVNGGARPGDLQFKDVNGDGVITTLDRTTIGSYMPDFTYGITNRFKYKNFDLVLFFQGVEGREILNLTTRHLLNGEANFNSYAEYNNRWISASQPGNGIIPRADRNSSLHGNNMRPSSFQVEDGSYFRLRNATLGYDVALPKSSQKLRIYVSGNNLLIWTKYLGFNPEVQQQSITSITPGEDYGAYPISSTYMIGLNFTF